MTRVPAGHVFLEALLMRFNPNHDPDTGEFSSGDGGGSSESDGGSLYSSSSKAAGSADGGKSGKSGSGSGGKGGGSGGSGAGSSSGSGGGKSSRPFTGTSPRNAVGSGRLAGASIARVFTPHEDHAEGLADRGYAPLSFNELTHDAAGAKVFHTLIDEAKQSNKFGAAVTLYPAEDYQKTRLFVTDDGKVGFALKGDDIVSVFKREGAPRGAVASLLPLAVQEGGKRLDCFDTLLPGLYSANGFKAVARTPFDDNYQPDGWDKNTFAAFNGGRPDVVFMVYDKSAAPYKAGDGKTFPSYDEAMAAQEKAVNSKEQSASALFDQYNDPSATADAIIDSVPGAASAVQTVERNLEGKPHTDAPASQGGFKQADGTYTPEREALHEHILDELFSPEAVKAATPANGERPVMTLLGGRGGSGKSWFTKQGIADAAHAIYINADDVQAKLPGYQGWNAALYHEEASDITKRADDRARALGLSVIHDATMRTPGGSAKRVADYKAAGYAVHGHYMFLPPQTSTQRAIQRFMRGGTEGRYVPASYLLNSTTNERTFDSLKPSFDQWSVYENTGSAPKLVSASEQEAKRNGRYSKRVVRTRSEPARRRVESVLEGKHGSRAAGHRAPEETATRQVGRRAFSPIIAYTEELFARHNEKEIGDADF